MHREDRGGGEEERRGGDWGRRQLVLLPGAGEVRDISGGERYLGDVIVNIVGSGSFRILGFFGFFFASISSSSLSSLIRP